MDEEAKSTIGEHKVSLLRLFLGKKLFMQYVIGKSGQENASEENFAACRVKVRRVIWRLFLTILMLVGGIYISDFISIIAAVMYEKLALSRLPLPGAQRTTFDTFFCVLSFVLCSVVTLRVIIGWVIKDGIHRNINSFIKREQLNFQKAKGSTRLNLIIGCCICLVAILCWYLNRHTGPGVSDSIGNEIVVALELIVYMVCLRIIVGFFLFSYAFDGLTGIVTTKLEPVTMEAYTFMWAVQIILALSAGVYLLFFWGIIWMVHWVVAGGIFWLYGKYRSIAQAVILDCLYVVILVMSILLKN
ncbi:MAG: hypothetical protein WCV63_09430 [Negativicutes bacterium]|jgi:hypothetical protein